MVSKPTEVWAVRRAEKAMLVQRIERALAVLKEEERRFVELRYFDQVGRSDLAVYLEMGMSERTGKRLKDRVLRKLATALNII